MSRDEANEVIRHLFESWYSSLVRYGYRLSGSLTDAEDAAQASFMALYEDLLQGRNYDCPEGWTLRVVQREIFRKRRRQFRPGSQEVSLSDFGEVTDQRRSEESLLMESDEMQAILSLLSPREQEVLLLRMETRRYSDIAEQLGISRNSVKTMLARALRKVRLARGVPDIAIGKEDSDAFRKTLQ